MREERGEEPGLDELDLPAEPEPHLAEPLVRAVEQPQHEQHRHVRVAEHDRDRQHEPEPRPAADRAVRRVPHEQARHVEEAGTGFVETIDVRADRREPVLAEQRDALKDDAEEREQIDDAEQAEDQPARQPVVARRTDPGDELLERRRRANIDIVIGHVAMIAPSNVDYVDTVPHGVCDFASFDGRS